MEKEIFNECMAIYWEWFQQERNFKPRIDASDGKGLKETVKYLFALTGNKDDAVNTFRYILSRWNDLSDYYRKGVRLRQINGNLVNILDFFKNERTVSTSYIEQIAKDLSQ